MKQTKWLAKAAALAMLISCCGCTSTPSSSGANAPSAGSSGGSSAPPAESQNAAPSQTVQEPVTLKVGYYYDSTFKYEGNETVENNSWTELYKENGINLEIMYNVDTTMANEKLAQCIMSGDYPDIMKVQAAYFGDWAQQNIFADITELYENMASDQTKEYYSSEVGQSALNAGYVDGRLYALPKIQDPYNSMSVLWLRKDWLDNMGLEIPRTIEEFVDVAKAFTENDPDGNGIKDTYGLGLNGSEVFNSVGGINRFFEMYGVVPGTQKETIPFIDVDGKAVYGGSLEGPMKDGLTLLHSMYEAGYIPKDFISAGADQVRQDGSAGKTGMFFGSMSNAGSVWYNALETQPEAEYVAAGIPGVTENSWGTAFYSATPNLYYTVSSKCTTPEAFMTIINLGTQYLAQPDTLSQEDYEKYNGLTGTYTGWKCALVEFEVPMKNLKALDRHQNALKTGDTSQLNAENLRDFNSMQDYLTNIDKRSSLNETELGKFNQGIFYYSVWGAERCGYAALNEMIQTGNLVYSAYDTVQTDAMIEITPTLDTLAKETIVNIIVGNQSVDSYSDFLKTWNSLGGEKITAEADAWYQSVKK